MKLTKESFLPYARQAIKDCGESKPAAGRCCVIATLRYIRDGLMDAEGKAKGELDIEAELNELIKQVGAKETPELAGFASNASAMAKACGYKDSNAALAEIAS